MDKKLKEIIKIIKCNPKLDYEGMRIQAEEAGISDADFKQAWGTVHSKGRKIKRTIDIICILIGVGVLLYFAWAYIYYLTHTI